MAIILLSCFTVFFEIPRIIHHLDFVNLVTFDFQTPDRDPKIADHSSSLYELYERNPEHNINYHVNYWLNNSAHASKINIAVPAFGRSWTMTQDSGITGYPPVPETNGPAPGGPYTVTPGLLSWPEICQKLSASKDNTGEQAPLRKVGDPTQRFGIYAYRAADEKGEHGLWVSYEDPASAAIKAGYAHAKGLGGVALFDLSMDDFRGTCAGEKFPLLRGIKYRL